MRLSLGETKEMRCLCKVHKFSENSENNTKFYVFKSFNNPDIDEIEEESEGVDNSNEHNNIKLIENKIKILKNEADCIIDKAKVEARSIIDKANREAVAVLNASSVEGYKKGLSLANDKTEEAIRNTKQKVAEIIENTNSKSETIINGLQDDMINLSLDIARKILDVELDRNDDVFTSIINKALSKLKTDTSAKIIMNAHDLSKLEDNKPNVASTRQKGLEYFVDTDMKKGDLIIETEIGTVDAGVNSQFTKIKSALVHEKVNAL